MRYVRYEQDVAAVNAVWIDRAWSDSGSHYYLAGPPMALPECLELLGAAFRLWRHHAASGASDVVNDLNRVNEDAEDVGEIEEHVTHETIPDLTGVVGMLRLEYGCNDPTEDPIDRAMLILRVGLEIA